MRLAILATVAIERWSGLASLIREIFYELSNIDQRSVSRRRMMAPSELGGIMAQASLKMYSPRLFTHSQLLELRRQMLRFARATPPGPERNGHRQVAASLRSLFRNKRWLDAHTVEGSQ
jgi:hypothetical protein